MILTFDPKRPKATPVDPSLRAGVVSLVEKLEAIATMNPDAYERVLAVTEHLYEFELERQPVRRR